MQRFRLHGPKQIVLDDVPEPSPDAGELLISVRSVGICGSDKHYFAEGRCGPFVPKTAFALGHEFSGIVAALGSGVAGFNVGDAVAVDPLLACGSCPMSTMTLKMGIERTLKDKVPGVTEVVSV